MLMFKKSNKDNGEKIFRYSIRKYHFGAASVAVAALMFFANGVQAQAPAISSATASDVVAGPSGNSDRDPQGSDEESPEKTAVVEQPVGLKSAGESSAPKAKAEEGSREESEAEVKSSQPETKIDDKGSAPVADTSVAKSIQGNLQALLANLTLDSMKSLHTEVEEGLAKAKVVLENPKATQEQVDEQATGGKRRKRGGVIAPEPAANQVSPTHGGKEAAPEANSQSTPQELPTYTNTTEGENGVYGLKKELEDITKELRRYGASEDKIQAAKAAGALATRSNS